MGSDKPAVKRKFKLIVAVVVVLAVTAVFCLLFEPLYYIAEAFADRGKFTAAAYTMRLSYFFDRDFDTLGDLCGYLGNSIDGSDNDAKTQEQYVRYAEMRLTHKEVEKLKIPEKRLDAYSSEYSHYLWILYIKGDTEKAKTKCIEEIEKSGRSTVAIQFLTSVINSGTDEDKKWARDTVKKIIDEGPYYDGMEDEIDEYKRQLQSIMSDYESSG